MKQAGIVFEHNGQTAYVFNDYVSDNKVEVAQSNSGGGSSLLSADSTTITLNGTDYPVRTWIDMENLFIYFEPSLNLPFEGDRAPILNSRDNGAFGCDQCYTLVDRGYSIGMMSANWIVFNNKQYRMFFCILLIMIAGIRQ